MTDINIDGHIIKAEEAWRAAQSGQRPEEVLGYEIRALTHVVIAVVALLQEVRVTVERIADSADRGYPGGRR